MRLEVTIPDLIYGQAQKAASASGVSFDNFITEAVQLRLEDAADEPVQLSAEQVAIIRKGQAEIKAGKFLTSEQVKADLAANRAAWQQENSL